MLAGKRVVNDRSLREMIQDIERDLKDGLIISTAANTTLNDMFEVYIAIRKDLKATTRYNYTFLYDKHIRNTLGTALLNQLRYTQIQKVYIKLNETLHYTTIQKLHCIIYQSLELAVRDNLLRSNPASNALSTLRNMSKRESKKRHALTEDQQASFVEYVYASSKYNRWATLITVLLGTGLRIGEALGLRWCDCDFKNNTITIDHTLVYKPTDTNKKYSYQITTPKTRAGIREIPMFLAVRGALLKEKENKDRPKSKFSIGKYTDFIFLNKNGKVFTPSFVFETLKNIVYDYNKDEILLAKQEGREPKCLPPFSAHNLRHTFCTRMCENESNMKLIQDVMGHKNIRTTMDVYNEATADKKQASFEKIEGKFKLA